jgi:uncharacterized repeat protein (TIGR01451 family)
MRRTYAFLNVVLVLNLAVAATGCQLTKQQHASQSSSSVKDAAYEEPNSSDNRAVATIQQLGFEVPADQAAAGQTPDDHAPRLLKIPEAPATQPNSDDQSPAASSGVARVRNSPARIPLPRRSAAPQAFTDARQPVFSDVRTVQFSPSEPRLELTADKKIIGGEQTLEARDRGEESYVGTASDRYPDEYIFDGGDRDHPVHYDDFSRHGLETEDTVAEFLDHRGKSHVRQTNRVAIYAPRFASVRTVSSPSGDIAIARVGGLQDSSYNSALRGKVGPDSYEANDQLRGVKRRSRASGVENKYGQRGVNNVRRLTEHTKLLNVYENNLFVLRGEFDQSTNARLAFGLKAAMHWTREQNPVVSAQSDATHQLETRFKGMEIVGTEEKHKRDGKLRIVKLADTKTAKPGDVITFVIRYDNLGDRELQHIQIVDNLTPRLEFIEDSAESDRGGDIQFDDNKEGSHVLTFKLDEPLPGKTGGVISFQCRVR